MKPLPLLVLIVLLVASTAAGAQTTVQAEEFSGSHDLAYYPIRSYSGLLEGLDSGGEWTQYVLPSLPFGTYQVHIRCWGNVVPYLLRLETYPVELEEPQTIDFAFVGKGSTCT